MECKGRGGTVCSAGAGGGGAEQAEGPAPLHEAGAGEPGEEQPEPADRVHGERLQVPAEDEAEAAGGRGAGHPAGEDEGAQGPAAAQQGPAGEVGQGAQKYEGELLS